MTATQAGRFIAALVVLLGAGTPAQAAEPGFAPVDVSASPIDQFRRGATEGTFGPLTFRGGLRLDSPNADFGAFSGLDFAADGRTFYAVTDRGFWFTARLVELDGRPVDIDGPMLAPMLEASGQPLVGKRASDAEGLRLLTRGGTTTALVSFEQVADVRAFAARPDLARARPRRIALPAAIRGLRGNYGLEAIAVAPAHSHLRQATIVIAERSLDQGGNHRGFVLGGPFAGAFSLRRLGDYDVTDAAFLPNGDLLVLERRFSFAAGVGMQLRRIPGPAIRPGAIVDGPVLLAADMTFEIDNMEGLAVRTGARGETLVVLISDDNLSPLQRTLLLQFELTTPVPPLPELRPAAPKPAPAP